MEDLKWIRAMSERLRDTLTNEYDDETKDLIMKEIYVAQFHQVIKLF